MSHRTETEEDKQAFSSQIKKHEAIARQAVENMRACAQRAVQFEVMRAKRPTLIFFDYRISRQVAKSQQTMENLTFDNFRERLFGKNGRLLSQRFEEILVKLVNGQGQNLNEHQELATLQQEVIEQECILMRHIILQKLSTLFPIDKFFREGFNRALPVISEREQPVASANDSISVKEINESLHRIKEHCDILEKMEQLQIIITSAGSILGLTTSFLLLKDSTNLDGQANIAIAIGSFTAIFCLCMVQCGGRRSLSEFLSSSLLRHRYANARQEISSALKVILENVRGLVQASEAVAPVADDTVVAVNIREP